jgi:hypothetical protein
MATITGADNVTVHQENDNHNDNIDHNNGDDTTGDTTVTVGDANVAPATGGAEDGTPGTTNFNLQVEQNKILEFFETKNKDTISAMDFIRQSEDLAKMN